MPYGLPCAGYAAFSISVNINAMSQIIHVERDGATRTFKVEFWNQLPAHKYGWKTVPAPVPAAVSNNMKAAAGNKATTEKKATGKGKKDAPEAPEAPEVVAAEQPAGGDAPEV